MKPSHRGSLSATGIEMLQISLIKFYRQYKEAFLELYSVLKYASNFLIQYNWETKYLGLCTNDSMSGKVANLDSMVKAQPYLNMLLCYLIRSKFLSFYIMNVKVVMQIVMKKRDFAKISVLY